MYLQRWHHNDEVLHMHCFSFLMQIVYVALQDGDVKMADATTAKTEKKAPKTSATPSAQTSRSKTLFVGNLSYSVERADVEEFFKGAGEVVDARFASNEEGVFKGFGHVEFATEAAAHKIHFAKHINVFESSSSFQIQNR
ncbi:nucleolin 1-like isoform X2 [Magnolia sinica]|uniref:nucleolin 1-like isoform X2 n=1 Tax=Magnolia sinica TaxID=86752 RepID=UPI002659D19C|nr:nucleolin 1-like isoform X2 [Magnolia sinica]